MFNNVLNIETTKFNYEGNTIAEMNMVLENAMDNAMHICKCVNSHGELVEALKEAQKYLAASPIQFYECNDKIKSALKNAQ